ncbi:1-phosphofructokinase family hexose kinase [Aceticella autotrophica]|uniref:Tagatose-6-phosphate kinase n=1 Tax=Aceticella autotrophica TaxID=2755338 RepID=A0A975AWY7_9THEO|nr:1-phosphofructokinase family hexose kinase [Aceticella autotrophica]QSZ28007.1 1-phosphofructokinase family hexose kinase [Aceticella autotrophica]
MIFTLTMNPSLDRYLYVDDLILDDTIRVKKVEEYAAGKGIDVSRVIREMGGTSVAICPLGGDNGIKIEFLLDNERVLYSAVRIKKETRMNIIVQSLKGQYRMSLPGASLTRFEYELIMDMIKAVPRSGDTLIASGSLPEGLLPSAYFEIVKLCKDMGLRVYVDTDSENLKEAVKASPFGIKPNIYELSRLIGKDLKKDEVGEAVKEISEKYGITDVLVTLGKDGAIAYVDKKLYKMEPIEVEVKSSVGAGDSFLAGFVHKRDNSIEDALKLAMACGSASVMNEGTTLCKKKDVKKLLKEVVIERIS